MDDRDFADLLYQQWSQTTGAENTYWQPIEHDHLPADNLCRFSVDAIEQDQSATRVAAGLREVDADFITAVHGCLPDLVRRLHDALDEADRLDVERDEQEGKYAEAIIRQQELEQLNAENKGMADTALEAAAHWKQQVESLRSKAADVLWKNERPM